MKCYRTRGLHLAYVRASELIEIQKRRKCFCIRMSDDLIGITADCRTLNVDRQNNGFQTCRTEVRNFGKLLLLPATRYTNRCTW